MNLSVLSTIALRRSSGLLLALLWAIPAGAQESPLEKAFERLPNGDLKLGRMVLHRTQRELSFPATISLTAGPLEVIVATPDGRLHESLLCTHARAVQVQAMLYLLGLDNGPRLPDATGDQGDLVDIDIAWTDADGTARREPVENWIIDTRTGTPLKRSGWVFVGSRVEDGQFLADVGGNIVINYSVADTILDSPDPASTEDTIHVVNEDHPQPGLNAPVRVILVPRQRPAP